MNKQAKHAALRALAQQQYRAELLITHAQERLHRGSDNGPDIEGVEALLEMAAELLGDRTCMDMLEQAFSGEGVAHA